LLRSKNDDESNDPTGQTVVIEPYEHDYDKETDTESDEPTDEPYKPADSPANNTGNNAVLITDIIGKTFLMEPCDDGQ
jgi:hypothetical protein